MISARLGLLNQRGIALLIVLWMTILLTVVASSFTRYAQVESLLTRRAVDRVKALEAAKAGIEQVIYQLKHPDPKQRPWADGRPYTITFEDITLNVSIQDEAGKISLHKANQLQLVNLFKSVGVGKEEAMILADTTLDFLDSDNNVRALGVEIDDYRKAGLTVEPKNAPLVVLEELLHIYGIDYSLYKKIIPSITILTSNAKPDMRLAPKSVLATLPDMTDDFLTNYLSIRFSTNDTNKSLVALPDGRSLKLNKGSSGVYSIDVEVYMNTKMKFLLKRVVDIR